MPSAAQSIADKLAAAAREAGDGAAAVTTVVQPADDAPAQAGDASSSGLNAGSILGGGFQPSPSPPPLAPPAPPGMAVLRPADVDNTMLAYTADSAAALQAALASANARHCTMPCSTITITQDIAVADTLRVNNSMVIVGACAAAPCKLNGGAAVQIAKVSGYYGYVEFASLEFANGKQNSAVAGVFGGAGARAGVRGLCAVSVPCLCRAASTRQPRVPWHPSMPSHVSTANACPHPCAVEVYNLGRALFTDCKFSGNTAGQGGAVAVYSGEGHTHAWLHDNSQPFGLSGVQAHASCPPPCLQGPAPTSRGAIS